MRIQFDLIAHQHENVCNAAAYLKLLVDVRLVHQGVENIQHGVHIPHLKVICVYFDSADFDPLMIMVDTNLWISLQCLYFVLGFLRKLAAELAERL